MIHHTMKQDVHMLIYEISIILFADMIKLRVKSFRIEDDKFKLISPSIRFIIGRGGVS